MKANQTEKWGERSKKELHYSEDGSAYTVVRAVYVSMGNAIRRGHVAPKRLDRFSKKLAQLISSETWPRSQIWRSVGAEGACLRMREIYDVS